MLDPRRWVFNLTLLLLFATKSVFAFVISDIDVHGLERISKGTVLNYLPLRVGEVFDIKKNSSQAIRALYDTDLFDDIILARQGNVLLVTVKERAAIGEINLEGNEKVDDDKLMETLKHAGIARGRVFNRSTLEEVENEVRHFYFSAGNYAAKINASTTPLPRNRVAVNIEVSEGAVARIRQINLVGNQAYSDGILLDLLDSGEYSANPFSTADEYSRVKLSGDIEKIRSYYMDRGYLNFKVSSTQVSISPDKKDIFVTIGIDEGARYKVSSLRLTGEFPVAKESLEKLIQTKEGKYFSRKKVTASSKEIRDLLGESGYAFANVNVVPEADDELKEVELTFFVDPGKRVYVRRINISGNTDTDEMVYRRELRQMEGGWLSPKALRRSKTRLQRLPFVDSVAVNTERVASTDDQVDINISIVEGSTGSFSIGVGVTNEGLTLNLDFNQENIFGTGNRWNLSFDNTKSTNQFSTSFTDPYYTEDGISRTVRAFAKEVDAGEIEVTQNYLKNSYGTGISFGIPRSEYSTLRLGLGWEQDKIETTEESSDEIVGFVDEFGDRNSAYYLNLGYTFDTRDRTIFATTGFRNSLSSKIAVPGSDLEYFKISNNFDYYYPFGNSLTWRSSIKLAYGDGYGGELKQLPFYSRYYAGGIRSLRGFESGSLGPRDSKDDASGGDFKTMGSLELVFPVPLTENAKTTRLSVFVDFGNVFADFSDFDENEFRVSSGISFVWIAPIGPLTFSYAEPMKEGSDDDVERFQFTIGNIF